MQETPAIRDIWFRTTRSLNDVADVLTLVDPEQDSEDVWHWVIGTATTGHRIDITRRHKFDRAKTDVRIFLVDGGAFSGPDADAIALKLLPLSLGAVHLGAWRPGTGDDFERVVVRTLTPME